MTHIDEICIEQVSDAASCSVLLVDDDELQLAQLASLLKNAGYQVYVASSGQEALRALDERPCQIVVTDWEMPGLDGLALCRALRSQDTRRYTYVLMLTVRKNKDEVLLGLGAGADDYVGKDVSSEELLARLEAGRRITHLERALRKSNEVNRRLSLTDALTGARNQRFLMKYLPRELERARRYTRPLTILSCDIDEFKRVNDTFGHDAGDEVLRAFVSRSMSCLRGSIDWIARTGGEEFVVVLPETPLHGGVTVADKLRQAFAAPTIPTASGSITVTVSVGVTALESADDLATLSVVELLRAADRCLYVSKRMGRDRSTSIPAARAHTLAAAVAAGGRHGIN
jgi:two-component system, cell cycle response regulator